MENSAKTVKGASIAVLAAAALTVVGTLMSWITFSGGLLIVDRSGVSYDDDAKWMIAFAAIAALSAIGELADVAVLPSFVRTSAVWDGLVIAGMGVYAITQLNQKVSAAQAAGAAAHLDAGVYVAIIGGVLMLVSGIRLWAAKRQVKTTQATAPIPA